MEIAASVTEICSDKKAEHEVDEEAPPAERGHETAYNEAGGLREAVCNGLSALSCTSLAAAGLVKSMYTAKPDKQCGGWAHPTSCSRNVVRPDVGDLV